MAPRFGVPALAGGTPFRMLLVWLSFPMALAVVEIRTAKAQTTLSADHIIQKAVARTQQAEAQSSQPAYTYTKLTVTEELDAEGNVKTRKERVYQVCFQNGATQLKLLSVNGRSPGDADIKMAAENEAHTRQMAGSSKSGKGDKRENFLTPDVVARFDFKLAGQTTVAGRAAYEITFQPRNPSPRARHIVDRFLDRVSGTVWIDAEEFEIARAQVNLGSEVNFLGGVVGSLKKMAYTLTRTRVADGLWLNSSSSGDFVGRKLLDSTHIKTQSQSTNFRPLG
jgi:hypothetical protein